ncbi:VOC family protein [Ornithinibacillus salinisoli]|uniref:VOC family protein n=1 Tax=Ornithinibacillus salinisoli TaxID=1848459 RepID=A0ABW4VXQ5_9BACI
MEKVQSNVRTPLLKKVHCNYIPVKSLEESAEWYEKVLGLKRFKDDGSIMVLGEGEWLFLLETKNEFTPNFFTDQWDGENYEMFSMTFEVDDIQLVYQNLQAHNVELEPIFDDGPCGLKFTFKDISGNKFHVWEDIER